MNSAIAVLVVIGIAVVGLAFAYVMDRALCWFCRLFGWEVE